MKQVEGELGLSAGAALLYTVLAAKLFVQYPANLINVGGPAGWQVALVMTAAGLLLFLPTAALAKRFPGRGLAQISEEVAGPFLGSLLTLAVVLWLFASFANGMRNFTETFKVSSLPITPPSALMMVIAGCAIYACYRGLEGLGRGAMLLLPIVAAGSLSVLLFSLPRVEIGRLYPFWGFGLTETLTGGLLYAGMAADAILLLMVGHAFREPSHLRQAGLIAIGLFGLTATATVLILITVFGSPDAGEQTLPMFTLARLVYLGRFVQRTEALITMFWVLAAAVRLSALLYGTVTGLAVVMRLPYYRPLLFPVTLLAFTLAFVAPDARTVGIIDRDWLRPLGLALMAVPPLLLGLAAVRRKGAKAGAQA